MQRFAVISATGTARKRTIPALADSELAVVTAIHGRDEGRLRALADDHSIPRWTTSVDELLAADGIDAVFVASPPFLHVDHVEAALAAGLPILCEKPLAASLADAERIVSAVRERGAPFGVAHHLRHQPAVVWLREQLATGMIGEVRTAHLQWSFVMDHDAPNAKWKLDPELGGRHALFDAGVHAVDLAIHLFGEPVRSTGLAATVRSARTADTASVLIEFDHGVLVTVTGSHAASHHGNTLEISGSDGAIVAFGGMGERPIEQLDVVTAEGSATQRFEPGSPYRFVVEDFVRQIEGATPRAAVTTLDEATWAMKVLEAVAGE